MRKLPNAECRLPIEADRKKGGKRKGPRCFAPAGLLACRPALLLIMLICALSPFLPCSLHAQGRVVPSGGQLTLTSSSVVTNLWMPLTTPNTWFTISCYNSSASTFYLMAFDTNTTNFAQGTVAALEPVPVPAGTTGGWGEAQGVVFRNGMVVAASTTPYTFTNAGPAFRGRLTFYNSAP